MSKIRKEKRGRGFIFSIIILWIGSTLAYVYLTRDFTLSDRTAYLTDIGLILVTYLLIRLFISILQTERLAGASMKKIDNMSGTDFEEWLSILYKRHGYTVKLTPATCDFGADLLIKKNGIKTVIQAKRYRRLVGESAIQQVIAAREYYDCDRAMAVTNSHYTEAARKLADKAQVILIDRHLLGGKEMFP